MQKKVIAQDQTWHADTSKKAFYAYSTYVQQLHAALAMHNQLIAQVDAGVKSVNEKDNIDPTLKRCFEQKQKELHDMDVMYVGTMRQLQTLILQQVLRFELMILNQKDIARSSQEYESMVKGLHGSEAEIVSKHAIIKKYQKLSVNISREFNDLLKELSPSWVQRDRSEPGPGLVH